MFRKNWIVADKKNFIGHNRQIIKRPAHLSIWRGLAGSSDAKIRILSESPKPFVKNWCYSKLFIGFLMAVSIENRTFADGL